MKLRHGGSYMLIIRLEVLEILIIYTKRPITGGEKGAKFQHGDMETGEYLFQTTTLVDILIKKMLR